MMNTFVVYVENKPGVLTRVASLFRRRAFNIDSLTVGRTEKPEVSRMTITAEADRDQARRIEANLYKLVNVLLVENITNQPAIVRDLAMIKVAATHEARSHVLELASVFRARRRRCCARFPHHRNHRRGRQDRWPARSPAALRSARNGSYRDRGYAPRQQIARPGLCRGKQLGGGRHRRRRFVLGIERSGWRNGFKTGAARPARNAPCRAR